MRSPLDRELREVEALARDWLLRHRQEATDSNLLNALRSLLAQPGIRLDKHSYVEAMVRGVLAHDRLAGPKLSLEEERVMCLLLRDLGRSGRWWDEEAQRFSDEAPRTAYERVRYGERFGQPPNPRGIRAAHDSWCGGCEPGSVPGKAAPTKSRVSREPLAPIADEIAAVFD